MSKTILIDIKIIPFESSQYFLSSHDLITFIIKNRFSSYGIEKLRKHILYIKNCHPNNTLIRTKF